MAAINDLIDKVEDAELRRRLQEEVAKLTKQKKFGLVWEDHVPESTILYDVPVRRGARVIVRGGEEKDTMYVLKIKEGTAECQKVSDGSIVSYFVSGLVCVANFGEPIYPYLQPMARVKNNSGSDLWHTLIQADNYHALQLLAYLYAGMVDCIYIDPPYNTGAKDWKYNNDYVDSVDSYRHSKWLSMMEKRLKIAKRLLNPKDSVLIVTIDEKEYLHLGCLLEEMFPEAKIQMISSIINPGGVPRAGQFYRTNEFIYFVALGEAQPNPLPLDEDWFAGKGTGYAAKGKVRWRSLRRDGAHNSRNERPKSFYPIYLNEDCTDIIGTGEWLPESIDWHTLPEKEGCHIIWPIKPDGTDGVWSISGENLLELFKQGYVNLGHLTSDHTTNSSYLPVGERQKVIDGLYKIKGHRIDGSLILDDTETKNEFVPGSQWKISSHDATQLGTKLLKSIIGPRFSFPKSLYAVHDTIRFFVANKPNALIVDFFAGSGTTLHAVNLLNAEDGGNRRCIMVTNNEVSDDEAKALTKQGYKPGDPEWERLGIAQYVNWPRTVCSIEGHDVNGNPLKGDYLGGDKDNPIHMADGFKANATFFKLGFLDKDSVALGRQFNELLPLLWLKAGAKGPCPEPQEQIPEILISGNFAVLTEETAFPDFKKQIEGKQIEVAFIITDSDAAYREMSSALPQNIVTYQLYKDYLDNFRINKAR